MLGGGEDDIYYAGLAQPVSSQFFPREVISFFGFVAGHLAHPAMRRERACLFSNVRMRRVRVCSPACVFTTVTSGHTLETTTHKYTSWSFICIRAHFFPGENASTMPYYVWMYRHLCVKVMALRTETWFVTPEAASNETRYTTDRSANRLTHPKAVANPLDTESVLTETNSWHLFITSLYCEHTFLLWLCSELSEFSCSKPWRKKNYEKPDLAVRYCK